MITDLSMDYVYFSQHFSSFFVSMSEMCCKTLLSAEVFTSHTDYVSMWIGKSQKKMDGIFSRSENSDFLRTRKVNSVARCNKLFWRLRKNGMEFRFRSENSIFLRRKNDFFTEIFGSLEHSFFFFVDFYPTFITKLKIKFGIFPDGIGAHRLVSRNVR